MNMKRLVILVVASMLLATCVAHAEAKTIAVSIKDFAFTPSEVTVYPGDTVMWTNDDAAPHDVGIDSLGKSPVLRKGESYSRTFEAPGTYRYNCDIHPSMKGTVIVS